MLDAFTISSKVASRIAPRGRRTELPPGPHEAPAWQLFAWSDGQLRAVVPPGRFASICSLDPGNYSFITRRVGAQAAGRGGGTLPEKGEIVVK